MSNRIDDLHPDMQPKAREFLMQATNAGLKAKITETWRSPEREDALHAQGITRATGATCKHCFLIDGKPASKAFDFALFNDQWHYIADGADPRYTQAGEIGEGVGMRWGGRFHHPDWDHFEID